MNPSVWRRILQCIDLRKALVFALVPLVVALLFVVGVKVYGLFRYDPAYFTDQDVENYESPSDVALALETALQTNDQALMREVQGLRYPATFVTSPNIRFVILLERTDQYFTYLYLDMDTYQRYSHYVEYVDGRWVVSPEDCTYYLRSGMWLRVALPLALVWWLVQLVVVLATIVFRLSRQMREEMYGY